MTAKTVRYYEQIGLLPAPARTSAGYRDYPVAALSRLRFVRTAQAAGLTLAEITGVLGIHDAGASPCAHVVALIDAHLVEIADRIAQLRAAQVELEQLAARAATLDPADCTGSDEVCRILTAAGSGC
ncbi:hypoxia response transcriptional regulator [Fodinicola feengrottensis]|uniref:Hypoxia response transcriptional regulator n=1 Tax=Fodinicola feengrottensis TaxID=435914 RepID=A0ABP4U1S0_9ACTN